VTDSVDDGYFKAYEEYSRTLRNWLTAYGIGAPVILLSNEKIWLAVLASEKALLASAFFLGAVSIQVILAALNKSLMWALYFGTEHPEFRSRRRYRVADWFSEQFWFDFICDSISVILLAVATLLVIRAVVIV
jgi:hypothetical protein